ncbi:MAG: PLP-dependent aminotransferase family protein [Pseudomonadota bacterium]
MKRKAGAILSSIRVDRSGNQKIGVQLYMALRDLILSGGLADADRLPASRTLASELAVSRTTVIDALDRLVAEGLLESRVGAGTFVSHAVRVKAQTQDLNEEPLAPCDVRLSDLVENTAARFAHRDRLPYQSSAFVTALPALDKFPMAQWARLSARHWRTDRDALMGYGDPFGLPELRSAISAHLHTSRGIHCDPDQIFIVGGAQYAFSLISRLLLNQGERVWFENPGAIGARNAFMAAGAELVPINIDDAGMVIVDGISKAPDFRLAFVTPSHQQPLGRVMSLSRRLELLQAASDANAYIVEDDYDGDFYFGNQPLPTLKSIDTRHRVIYVGTFSKTLFPSLRLGFLLAPPALVDPLRKLAKSFLSGTPTWPQAVVADFINEGFFATHIRTMRALYRERHDELHQHATLISPYLEVQLASAGFHTVGFVKKPFKVQRFIASASNAGVVLSDIKKYCIEPVNTKGVVLGYGSCDVLQIKSAMKKLARVFESCGSEIGLEK